MPNGAAKDATQDVAAPFVRRKHSIRQEEGDSARVIGNDTKRSRVDGVRDDPPDAARTMSGDAAARLIALTPPIRHADDLLDGPEDRREEIRVKVARGTLHHRGDALEPRARVDRRLRKRGERPVRPA